MLPIKDQIHTLPGGEQAARAQTLSKIKAIGMKGVVTKGKRQRVK